MTDSRMVRSRERKALIESLMKMAEEYAKQRGRRVDFDLSRICLMFIEHGGQSHIPHNISMDAWKFFYGTLLIIIENFARAHEERNALVCGFYQRLGESVTRQYHADLSRLENVHPEKLFR